MPEDTKLVAITGVAANGRPMLPASNIARLGLVSRDHRHKFQNGFRDFSFTFHEATSLLDAEKCDAILFALWSFDRRNKFDVSASLRRLRNVETVFVEEFSDVPKRKRAQFFVNYRMQGVWHKSEPITQCFGSLRSVSRKALENFVKIGVAQQRVMGNFCIIICGESNGVPVSKIPSWKAHDQHGLRQAIAEAGAVIVLNPGHDLMLRPEMKLKRQFLSENGRFVVSVWNRGKVDRRGINRDGQLLW